MVPDKDLNEFRQQGDRHGDALIATVLEAPPELDAPDKGLVQNLARYRYNHLLSLADRLILEPGLLLRHDSELARELSDYSEPMQRYYAPAELPDWVDSDKLKRASRVWQDNMVAILGVLYSASLPYCYTIRHGLPLLYDTGKLLKPEFIYQRIHETGLMLEAVMKPDGLRIVEDMSDRFRLRFEQALQRLRPGAEWRWHQGEFQWLDSSTSQPDWEEILAELERDAGHDGGLGARRFLWGDGLLATRKVRLLHAAMRYMILHPDYGHVSARFAPSPGWDLERYGKPINQEDLAFTLLTFAYVIPRGLQKLGCHLSLQDREAFLHCWRLVGHELGIDDALLTDNWSEAESLFATLLKRQGGPSEPGRALASTLYGFFGDYLPRRFGLDQAMGPIMVRQQLGDEVADWLMDDAQQVQSRRWLPRVLWGSVLLALRLYYPIRNGLMRRFPSLRRRVGGSLHRAGMALVDSWRGAFWRKPFYLPQYLNAAWKKPAAAGPEFRKALRGWRHGLVERVALGLVGLVLGTLGLLAVLVATLLDGLKGLEWSLGISMALALYGLWQLGSGLDRWIARRPRLPDA